MSTHEEDEERIEELLADIDTKLDLQIKKAKARKENGKPPTGTFSPSEFKKTQSAFLKLSQQSPMEESTDPDEVPPPQKKKGTTWIPFAKRNVAGG